MWFLTKFFCQTQWKTPPKTLSDELKDGSQDLSNWGVEFLIGTL